MSGLSSSPETKPRLESGRCISMRRCLHQYGGRKQLILTRSRTRVSDARESEQRQQLVRTSTSYVAFRWSRCRSQSPLTCVPASCLRQEHLIAQTMHSHDEGNCPSQRRANRMIMTKCQLVLHGVRLTPARGQEDHRIRNRNEVVGGHDRLVLQLLCSPRRTSVHSQPACVLHEV